MNTQANSVNKLVKNIGLLSISQFSSKILSFFLVPLYTSVLSTAEYGTYDFFNTTISLLVPILTLQITEAVLRFSLDEKENKEAVLSNGIIVTIQGLAVFAFLVGLNAFFKIIPSINEYLIYFVIYYILRCFHNIVFDFARGINKVAAISIAGVISTAIVISGNIIFLLVLQMGLEGYFIANFMGGIVSSLFLIINTKMWRYLSFRNIDKALLKSMLSYSVPLILNQVSWWINSASDRYVVIYFCGVAVNGIYAIGYKIPTILNVFQGIFNKAWILSTVQDYDEKDRSGFFSTIYNVYNASMVLICSAVILSTRILARVLYSKDFFNAWIYVPFLTMAIVFGAMSGFTGGIITARKDSRTISLTTFIGAIVNISLNILFVYLWGAIGAAYATTISYWIVWQIRLSVSKKYIRFKINLFRDYASYLVLLLQSGIMILFYKIRLFCYGFQIFGFILIMFLYKSEIRAMINKMRVVISKR